MPKSSATYETELIPDARLRAAVLAVAAAMLAGGLLVIVTLPAAPGWRVAGAAVWLAGGAHRFVRLQRGFARCERIRIAADGSVQVESGAGPPAPARLMQGSVVLGSIAWLRIRIDGGGECVELLTGNARKSHAWRRLQVIWRHLGAGT